VITARVSHVAAFARWRQDEDADIASLVLRISGGEETEQMEKGTAFHKFLELAQEGTTEVAEVNGYTFAFVGDFSLYLPRIRERRLGKDYGGITVSGCVDAMEGKTIYDHKTTERFDAESYLDSWQHRFYLDIFGADKFIWNVWEMNELKEPKAYGVHTLHQLVQYRYPAMEQECRELALEYKEFAERHLTPEALRPFSLEAKLEQSLRGAA
jgi:hypothetical protein